MENTEEQRELFKSQLKVQALRERVASLTDEYENKIADLRVDMTMLNEALNQTTQELENSRNVAQEADGDDSGDAGTED